jgi:uncharacterized protein YkwD
VRRTTKTLCVFALTAAVWAPAGTPKSATTRGHMTLTAAETALLNAINTTRGVHGLAPLTPGYRLERAARWHSYDMIRRNYFAHGDFSGRMYRFRVYARAMGENLAWHSGTLGATTAVAMWLASPPHRANLLRPGYRRIGIGAFRGRFQGTRRATVVTVDFAGS